MSRFSLSKYLVPTRWVPGTEPGLGGKSTKEVKKSPFSWNIQYSGVNRGQEAVKPHAVTIRQVQGTSRMALD